MTELHLNGQPAVLPSSLNIKINHENVYLTAASQYTLDIELPLQGCPQNLAIFGHINRIDAHRRNITLQALLTADGKIILKGSAVITSITRQSVKVQLLAGNSEFNFFGRGEGMYINEMQIYATVTAPSYERGATIDETAIEAYQKGLYAQYPEQSCVFFPIWNETLGGTMNNQVYRVMTTEDDLTYPVLGSVSGSYTNAARNSEEKNLVVTSPQPYLCWLIEAIVNNMGYELVRNDMLDTPLQQIFICLPGNSWYVTKYLPHWTVNEFFRQLERFLGMVLVVDDVKMTAELVSKRQFFKDNVVCIENIVDEFEMDIDDDTQADVSEGRVGYTDNGLPPEMSLPAAVFRKATIVQTEIDGVYTDDSPAGRCIYEHEGRRFIHWTDDNGTTYYDRMVDQARPRPAQGDEEDDRTAELDIELKFVPARTTIATQTILHIRTYDRNDVIEKEESFSIPMLAVEGVAIENRIGRSSSADGYSLQEYIEDESLADEDIEVPDYIEVAYNDGRICYGLSDAGVKFNYRFGKTFCGVMGNMRVNDLDFDFGLVQTNTENIYSLCHSGLLRIDKTAKRIIKFLPGGSVDPKKLFIIRGKRFICEKIERQVDAKGVQPMATGYFYEVSETDS